MFNTYQEFLDFVKDYVNRHSAIAERYIEVFIWNALDDLVALYDWRPTVNLIPFPLTKDKYIYTVAELENQILVSTNIDGELKKITVIYNDKGEKITYYKKTIIVSKTGKPEKWWQDPSLNATDYSLYLYPKPDKDYIDSEQFYFECVVFHRSLENSPLWRKYPLMIAAFTQIVVLRFLGENELARVAREEAEEVFTLKRRKDDQMTPVIYPLKYNLYKLKQQ